NFATGISASTRPGNYGAIDIVNSGDVNVTATGGYSTYFIYGSATGISVTGQYLVDIDNSGSIDVSAYITAFGIDARTYYDDLTIDNSGTITVDAGPSYVLASYATGINAYNIYGDVEVSNSGLVSVLAHPGFGVGEYEYTILGSAEAMGIYAQSYGIGNVLVDNSGTV